MKNMDNRINTQIKIGMTMTLLHPARTVDGPGSPGQQDTPCVDEPLCNTKNHHVTYGGVENLNF